MAVFVEIPARLSGSERRIKRIELLDHRRGQLRARNEPARLAQDGRCDLRDLADEVLLALADVEADARHDVLELAGLTLDAQLGQNAAELSAVQDEIVCPLDLRVRPRHAVDRAAHRNGDETRERHQLRRRKLRAQQDRQVNALARRALKAAAAAAASARLLRRDGDGTVRRAVERDAL